MKVTSDVQASGSGAEAQRGAGHGGVCLGPIHQLHLCGEVLLLHHLVSAGEVRYHTPCAGACDARMVRPSPPVVR